MQVFMKTVMKSITGKPSILLLFVGLEDPLGLPGTVLPSFWHPPFLLDSLASPHPAFPTDALDPMKREILLIAEN